MQTLPAGRAGTCPGIVPGGQPSLSPQDGSEFGVGQLRQKLVQLSPVEGPAGLESQIVESVCLRVAMFRIILIV